MRINYPFLFVFLFLLVGCGGGGGNSSSPNPAPTETLMTINPGESLDKTVGSYHFSIPAGAFPDGTDLTIRQYATPPFRPGNPRFVETLPALEISSTAAAYQALTVSAGTTNDQTIVGLQIGDSWQPLSVVPQNGQLNFTLAAPQGQAPTSRGLGDSWRVIVGLIKDNLPDSGYGIYRIAGEGELGPNSAIVVHGIFDNYQSMTTLGQTLQPLMGWKNVYSLAYDYHVSTPEAAQYLATILDSLKANGKSIDLVGHSRGTLVIRHAMEKLHATETVKNCLLICGPHLGGNGAQAFDLFKRAEEIALNSDTFNAYVHALFANDTWTNELVANSNFLQKLNTPSSAQRGQVNYFLVGGEDDTWVSPNSALADGVMLEAMTNGLINRQIISGATHGSAVNDPAIIKQIGQLARSNGPIEASIEPNPAEASQDGWELTITIRNNGSQSVQLADMSFDTYDKGGNWAGIQWYDSAAGSGTFYPNEYRPWNETIAAGQTLHIPIHCWPDYDKHSIDEVPASAQAGSNVISISSLIDGQKEPLVRFQLNRTYGPNHPSPPRTRAPHQINPGRGLIGAG